MYELFDHTADLGLRIRAASREELFAQAGQALLSVIVANPQAVRAVHQKRLVVEGDQLDYLLFDWLSELLYAFDCERLLLSQFDLQLGEDRLTAVCRGEPLDTQRHQLDHEVKAITYHGLKVEQTSDGWLAEVILDI